MIYLKKCELLSPVGNMEMLKYAILYGADAVYLGGTRFGARKFATNFDEEQLKEAIQYSHIYGVKVYVTINTLIREDEVKSFLEYVKFIYKSGVDAVLVQDIGMLSVIRKVCPNLEIHASTQMHNNGKDILEFLAREGVKRVVLDREMTLDEIVKLPKSLEKEVFCHGALCVSYSGRCLFSSLILGRSGNRGECAGLCRLPYRLKTKDKISQNSKYYLSLKDLSITTEIEDILKSGVDCLKIEGRLKSPEYVGYMTKIYRELIDSFYAGKIRKLSDEEKENINILFNRGLTKGFISNATNDEMVNRESPNHIGIHLGYYVPRKEKIELSLDGDLKQGDVIRFKEANKGMTVNFLYDIKGNLINGSKMGSTVWIDNFLELKCGGEIRKVGSRDLEKTLAVLPNRRVKIRVKIEVLIGKPMCLQLMEKNYTITEYGVIPELAIKSPVTEENISKQIKKTGDSVYDIESLEISLDKGLFVNIKDLNELRRKALESLDKERCEIKGRIIDTYEQVTVETRKTIPKILVTVRNKEQYEVAKKYTDEIYTSNRELLKKLKGKIYPKFESFEIVDEYEKALVCDLGSLMRRNKIGQMTTDYSLNLLNSYSLQKVLSCGVKYATVSLELDLEKLNEMAGKVDFSKVGIFLYGKVELMKMKFDPVGDLATHLVDRNDKEYYILKERGFNYLMSHFAIDKIEYLPKLKVLGVGLYRVDFLDESEEKCTEILERIIKILYRI